MSDLYNMDSHVSVRQFLQEIVQLMQQFLRLLSVKDDTLGQIQLIGDLAYGWETVDQ